MKLVWKSEHEYANKAVYGLSERAVLTFARARLATGEDETDFGSSLFGSSLLVCRARLRERVIRSGTLGGAIEDEGNWPVIIRLPSATQGGATDWELRSSAACLATFAVIAGGAMWVAVV